MTWEMSDARLAEHLAAEDRWSTRCDALDGLVRYILDSVPDTFSCNDERDEWIAEQVDKNLVDNEQEYIVHELRYQLS